WFGPPIHPRWHRPSRLWRRTSTEIAWRRRERRRSMRSKAILSVVVLCGSIALALAAAGSGCHEVTDGPPGTGRALRVEDGGPAAAHQSGRRDAMPGATEPDAPAAPDAAVDGGGAIDEAACNACEAASCRNVDGLDLYAACFLATDNAMSGPGAGMPKSTL